MSGRIVRAWRRHASNAAFAAMAALFCARVAHAHPIHTTLTVLTPSADGRVLTLSIRAFADDFSASVARFAGRRPPRDSSVVADEVTRYVRAQFTVAGAEGQAIALEPCGVTRSRELYWLCFRVTFAGTALGLSGVRGATVRNAMLTELHADQVNIVQLESGTSRKSFLFTKASEPSALP